MTSHDFAQQLLTGPNLPIILPKVKEYDFDDEEQGEPPAVFERDGERFDGTPQRVLIISHAATAA